MLAFGVTVDVGNSVLARIALGVHETDVLSENLARRPSPGIRAFGKKKPADDQPADKGFA
jgi:hypothetical protein